MKALLGLLCFGAACAWAAPAAAHLGLRYPPSRYGDNVLKVGPCGVDGGARSANVTVLEPGAALDVVWDEYVNHPGHFRIAFDSDGDDDFVDPACLSGCDTRAPIIEQYSNAAVLLDGIPDTPNGGESGARVTLPDVECERCTLQVIQVMYDKPPYVTPGINIYYQCADLALRRSGASTPPPVSSPTPPPPTPTPSPSPGPPTPLPTCSDLEAAECCVGDCDGNREVSVDELVTLVAIALGEADISACAAGDGTRDAAVQVEEIVAAVRRSLEGCAQL